MNRLPSVKSRFCQEHESRNRECCVVTCLAPSSDGFQTCADPAHRKLESRANEQNKAMFQLKRRAARGEAIANAGKSSLNVLDEDVVGDAEDSQAAECTSKPGQGNRTFKAYFGRKHTHNEELAVASCGIILGRATFYGSEAPNGVRVSATVSLSRPCPFLTQNAELSQRPIPHQALPPCRHMARQ